MYMKYQDSEERETRRCYENLTVLENIISNIRRKDCLDLVCVLACIFRTSARLLINW